MFRLVPVFAIICCLAAVDSFAQTPQAARPPNAEGRLIYVRSCAICHGMDMKGRDANWQPDSVFVPPLDAGGKAWRMTDAELHEMVQGGRHAAPRRILNAGMPPFGGRLTDQEIVELLAYLKAQWTNPQREYQAQATAAAALPPEARAEFGAQLYAAKCAVCHGIRLEGQTQRIGAPGQEQDVAVPPLTHNILAQAMSDSRLRSLIIDGEAHHPFPHSAYRMPDMRVSEEEANALLFYLRQVWQGKAP